MTLHTKRPILTLPVSERDYAQGPATAQVTLAVLYEALSGRPPFRGESAADTERQVIADEPVPPSRLNARVPKDLETICLKCLAKDPARRYASAAALGDDLGRFQRGEPVTARRAGRIERATKWVRRRPVAALLWAGAALAVLGASAGVASWATERTATERAIEHDLREVAKWHRLGNWREANATLDRATQRLRDGGPRQARAGLEQARRDTYLGLRLQAIRTSRAAAPSTQPTQFADASAEYAAAFREAGLGGEGDDPAAVAARIVASNLRRALVAALYDWMDCGRSERREEWLLKIAREADPDPTGWRDQILARTTWRDPTSVAEVMGRTRTPAPELQTVELLLAVPSRITDAGRDPVPFLLQVQNRYPDDFWVNLRLAMALTDAGDYPNAMRYAQVAVTLYPESPLARHTLGTCLLNVGRLEEALAEFRRAASLDQTTTVYSESLRLTLARLGRSETAAAHIQVAVPGLAASAERRESLCDSLEALGWLDELRAHYREALATSPFDLWWQARLRAALARGGQLDGVLVAWRETVDQPARPQDKAAFGYPEYCLFLGRTDEYRRACQVLLDRYERGSDPSDWEYIARTCLLVPRPEQDARRADVLIDRALALTNEGDVQYRFLKVTKGLGEYRLGRHEAAIATMEHDAHGALAPVPQLVIAMSRSRLGEAVEARRALALAVASYDWSSGEAEDAEAWNHHVLDRSRPRRERDGDPWVCHVLRREAEAMILPDLPAFLEGRYQPTDADQCLATTAACEFRELHAAHARFWARAYATDPLLAAPGRLRAFRAAALAGCGSGNDAAGLGEAERSSLRRQARQWLGQELAAASEAKSKDGGGGANHEGLRAILGRLSAAPELAAVRDAAGLAALPANEAREWRAIWDRCATLLRTEGRTPQTAGPKRRPAATTGTSA